MTDFIHEIFAEWRDRWRYPSAVALLADPSRTPSNAELADAVAIDLGAPPATRNDSVRVLIDAGEFGAVSAIVPAGELTDELRARLDEARTTALRELDRRHDELLARGRRARHARLVERSRLTLEAELHPARVARELDEWEEGIEQAEQELAEELERQLVERGAKTHPAWAEAVRACLAVREFPTAAGMIDVGPDAEAFGGPIGVPPGQERWPWRGRTVAEVLAWYTDGAAEPPPEFIDRWRPAGSDTAGWQLLHALGALLAGPMDAAVVQSFAEALDTVLGVEGTRHAVAADGDGFRTVLYGVHDRRLVRLGVPDSLAVWTSANGGSPGAREAATAWLDLTSFHVTAPPPSGVARLTADVLFRLLAPTPGGQPMSVASRRINLLRAVYPQLPMRYVFPEHGGRLNEGSNHELRDDVAWLLDLLGVQARMGVVDAICYDTAGYPPAVSAAFDGLLPHAVARPTELTVDDLAAWRHDPTVQAAFRERVHDALREDPEITVVTLVAVWIYEDNSDTWFGKAEIDEWLVDFFDDDQVEPARSVLSDVGVLLERAVSAGLLRRNQDRYSFRTPGLVSVLNDDVHGRVVEALDRVRQRHRLVMTQVDLRLRDDMLTSTLHSIKNELFALRSRLGSLAAMATRPASEEDARGLLANIAAQLTDAGTGVAVLEQRCQSLLRKMTSAILDPESFDVNELARELKRYFEWQNPGEIAVRVDASGEPLVLFARKILVRLALENLMMNALQAQASVDAPKRAIVLHLHRSEGELPGTAIAYVVIDIEDAGPGLPPRVAKSFSAGELVPAREGEVSRGIDFTRGHVTSSGGTFDYLGRSEELGGAHFRIRLPLHTPSDPPQEPVRPED
ncbi:sensor histidine kinase [Actinophytocola xanthii]|uniref:Histidine kinase domain-containing protein n=1 Tax=Actinophytocola xanthii TaxID=1912961 RepID=A0A1Q8CKI8_9PSEU|nr:ATP-binding protein [Actinophytocola xanthii]OLF14880.1 hypothetical protein BU204_24365 [Actinophytocola xanthii]